MRDKGDWTLILVFVVIVFIQCMSTAYIVSEFRKEDNKAQEEVCDLIELDHEGNIIEVETNCRIERFKKE